MYLIASEGKHSIRAFIQIYYPQKALGKYHVNSTFTK
jgi:hypothetical protein